MCSASKPKVQQAPDPPPPITPVTEDQVATTERQRENRRAAGRSGRTSTILAGSNGAIAGPTTQAKTVLGA
jgi:hypothetical protein